MGVSRVFLEEQRHLTKKGEYAEMEIERIGSLNQLTESERRLIHSITEAGKSPKRGYYVIYKERFNGDVVTMGEWYGEDLAAAVAACKKAEARKSIRDAKVISVIPGIM